MDTTQGRTRRAVLATVGAAAVSGVAWASDSTSDTLRVTQDGAALVDDVTEIDADTFEERLLDDGTATFRPIDPDAETFAEFPADLGTTDFSGDVPEFVGQVTLGGRPLSNVTVRLTDIDGPDLDADEDFDAALTDPLGRVVFPDQFGKSPDELNGSKVEELEFETALTDDGEGPTRLVAQTAVFDANDSDGATTPARFTVGDPDVEEDIREVIAVDGDGRDRITDSEVIDDLLDFDEGRFELQESFHEIESDSITDETDHIDVIYRSTPVIDDAGFLGIDDVEMPSIEFDFTEEDTPAFEAIFVEKGLLAPGETVRFGHVAVHEGELQRGDTDGDLQRELELDIDADGDLDYSITGTNDDDEMVLFPEEEVGAVETGDEGRSVVNINDFEIDVDEGVAGDIEIEGDSIDRTEVRFKRLKITDDGGKETTLSSAADDNGTIDIVFEAVDGSIGDDQIEDIDDIDEDDRRDIGESYPDDFPDNFKLIDDFDKDGIKLNVVSSEDDNGDADGIDLADDEFSYQLDITGIDDPELDVDLENDPFIELDIDIDADGSGREITSIEGGDGGVFDLNQDSKLVFDEGNSQPKAEVDIEVEGIDVEIPFEKGTTEEVDIPAQSIVESLDVGLLDGDAALEADFTPELQFDFDEIAGLTRGVPLGEIDLAERAAEIGLENVETTIEVTSPATELDDATGRIDPDTIVRLFLAFETEDIREHGLAVRNRRLRFPADADDSDQTVVQPAAARSADDIISLRSNRARLRPGRQPLTTTDTSDDLPTVYVLADLLPPDTSGELASDAINALDGLRMRVEVASRLTGGS